MSDYSFGAERIGDSRADLRIGDQLITVDPRRVHTIVGRMPNDLGWTVVDGDETTVVLDAVINGQGDSPSIFRIVVPGPGLFGGSTHQAGEVR